MQWRDPATIPETVEDPGQRGLLLQDTVCAVPFETFKRLIVETAFEPPVKVPVAPLNSSLFVNAEKSDIDLARQIQEYVGKHAWVYLPVTSGKPEEIRQNIEDNIVECDGLLVLYGDGSAVWVQQQLRLYNKLAPRRQRPIKLLAVIDAPPDGKPDVNVQFAGMRIINCRKGIDETALKGVLDTLATEPAQ
jgi:hypothetical protein